MGETPDLRIMSLLLGAHFAVAVDWGFSAASEKRARLRCGHRSLARTNERAYESFFFASSGTSILALPMSLISTVVVRSISISRSLKVTLPWT